MSDSRKGAALARRFVAVALLLVVFLTSFPVEAYDRSSGERPGDPGYLADGGIYTIRNAATGTYLFAFNYSLKRACKTIVADLKKSEPAQYFRISSTGTGEWVLIPRSEDEKYALGYPKDSSDGSFVTKLQVSSDSRLSYFDITFLPGGLCTIAPSSGDNVRAVLSVPGNVNEDGMKMAVLSDYKSGDRTQLWFLEKVETENLTMSFSHTRFKLYSTGTLYARKYPDNADTADIIWYSDNESVLLVSSTGDYCALSPGVANITACADGSSVTANVEVVDSDCFTWYSQNSISVSNWDGTNLRGLKFYGDGRTRLFALDFEDSSVSWLSGGCTLCSCAMVLNNLGATLTKGYDLRSGQEGNLPADPYTVALANTGNYGVDSIEERMTGNPVYVKWARIASRFTVDGEEIGFKKYYSPTKILIKSLIEKHPAGVIIGFQKGTSTHYMVAAGLTDPNETVSSKISFIVYDPSAYVQEKGDGVPLSDTYSRGGYIFAVYVFDVASNLK